MGLNTTNLDQNGHQSELTAQTPAAHQHGQAVDEHGHQAAHGEKLAQVDLIPRHESARQQGETRFDKEPILPQISNDSSENLSLGHVLAVVGDALLKARASVEDALEKEADQIDEDQRKGRANSAERNQKIAALTFALQTIQQVDNIVVDAVQNVSKTQSDGLKSVAQNLRG